VNFETSFRFTNRTVHCCQKLKTNTYVAFLILSFTSLSAQSNSVQAHSACTNRRRFRTVDDDLDGAAHAQSPVK
jgi:hypothetical protein